MIRVKVADAGIDVSYLPWKEDECTCVLIAPSADLFLTGPLNGCHVYIAEKPGFSPLAIHVNANRTPGLTGTLQKDRDAINAATRDGYVLTLRLSAADYNAQGSNFVWGRPNSGGWKFFVHEVNRASGAFTNTRLQPLP